jgi:endonuclease YncB( thermonuclease family)
VCDVFYRSRAGRVVLGPISAAAADDLTDQASIIDGDTVEIQGSRIRLWGVDAPESTQLCRGEERDQYRCGAQAANDWMRSSRADRSAAFPINLDRYGRTVATYSVAGTDVGEWLVQNRLALDWPQYSKNTAAA